MKEFQEAKRAMFIMKKEYLEQTETKIVFKKREISKLETALSVETARSKHREKLNREMKKLKSELSELEKDDFDLKQLVKKWLSSSCKNEYKNITKLLKICAVIPGATAVVERSYSIMNLLVDPLPSGEDD